MEKLDAYLKANSITRAFFAAQIGVAKSTMTEMLQRKFPPPLSVSIRIEDATGGAVTVRDLV